MSNYTYSKIEPYDYRLIIATIETEKQGKELVSKFGIDEPSINRLGGVYTVLNEGWKTILVFLNFNAKQTITYGMVAHECLHIVDTVCTTIGHDYDVDNNETMAYLLEYLVDKVFEHLEKMDLIKKISPNSKVKEKYKIINEILNKNEGEL